MMATLRDFFDVDRCQECGDCLKTCPELCDRVRSPERTIKALKAGIPVADVLDSCSSCMTCSVLCPNGCNPYGLILYRWFERSLSRGYPLRASLVMPLEEENAWRKLTIRISEREKALLSSWIPVRSFSKGENPMFAGCNLRIMPFLADSPIFDRYTVFGDMELCCGEVYYRMGALNKVRSIALEIVSRFSDLDANSITCYCQACYNMLSNVLPKYFGVNLGISVHYFGDDLHRSVISGELGVKDILKGLTVTVHDPCHSKLLGKEFQEKPRNILERIGANVIEMKHSYEMSLCCGLGHGAARYNPFDMLKGIVNRLREARASGADYLVVYCNSCYILFSIGNLVTLYKMPTFHINELVSAAAGYPLKGLAKERAAMMLRELFVSGAPKIFSLERFYL